MDPVQIIVYSHPCSSRCPDKYISVVGQSCTLKEFIGQLWLTREASSSLPLRRGWLRALLRHLINIGKRRFQHPCRDCRVLDWEVWPVNLCTPWKDLRYDHPRYPSEPVTYMNPLWRNYASSTCVKLYSERHRVTPILTNHDQYMQP